MLFETEPVKYKIIFDNYYSWFTSKTIKYKINIVSIIFINLFIFPY